MLKHLQQKLQVGTQLSVILHTSNQNVKKRPYPIPMREGRTKDVARWAVYPTTWGILKGKSIKAIFLIVEEAQTKENHIHFQWISKHQTLTFCFHHVTDKCNHWVASVKFSRIESSPFKCTHHLSANKSERDVLGKHFHVGLVILS